MRKQATCHPEKLNKAYGLCLAYYKRRKYIPTGNPSPIKPLTLEQRNRIILSYSPEYTAMQIANISKMSVNSVRRVLREQGLETSLRRKYRAEK